MNKILQTLAFIDNAIEKNGSLTIKKDCAIHGRIKRLIEKYDVIRCDVCMEPISPHHVAYNIGDKYYCNKHAPVKGLDLIK